MTKRRKGAARMDSPFCIWEFGFRISDCVRLSKSVEYIFVLVGAVRVIRSMTITYQRS